MWKYIVTYMVIIATPILKEVQIIAVLATDGDGRIITPPIPPIEYKTDTLYKRQEFKARADAELFIRKAKDKSNGFRNAYTEGGYPTNFKLDSVRLK